MNIPNALSLLRIFLVPAFIWAVMEHHFQLALWIFVVAGTTDGLDGYIATRFNQRTEVGAYLDPLADKALILAGFIVMTIMGRIPFWLTLMVVSRDFIIVGGAILYQLVTNDLRMEPLWISKVNTVAQLLLLLVTIIYLNYDLPMAGLLEVLFFLVAVTTIVSGVSYVLKWIPRATEKTS